MGTLRLAGAGIVVALGVGLGAALQGGCATTSRRATPTPEPPPTDTPTPEASGTITYTPHSFSPTRTTTASRTRTATISPTFTVPPGSTSTSTATPLPAVAYVANAAGFTTVISLAGFSVIASIPSGASTNPSHVSFAPNGSRAYTVNRNMNSVTAINAVTHTFLANVNTGIEPITAGVSPDGSRLFVANYDSSQMSNPEYVTVIETSNNTIAGPVQVPNYAGLRSVLRHASLNRIYVSADGGVVEIDPVAMTLLNSTNLPNATGYACIEQNGGRLFIPGFPLDAVDVVGTATMALVATVPAPGYPFHAAVTPDGSWVVTTARGCTFMGNTAYIVDTSTYSVAATLTVGTRPEFAAITPDGSLAYVANGVTGNVSVIDIAQKAVIATVSIGGVPYHAEVTPNGSYAFVTRGGIVSVISTSTQAVVASVNVGGNASWIAMRP